MPHFGHRSREHLRTLDHRLVRVMNRAIEITDFKITDGYRGEQAQEDAHRAGHSQLHFPLSKHNRNPSQAVDVAPWPINWANLERFHYLAGVIMGAAHEEQVEITWGGSWAMRDLPHFELAQED